jgi:hypothetical protein
MSFRIMKRCRIDCKKISKIPFPEGESSYDTSIYGLRPRSLLYVFRNLFGKTSVDASKAPLGRWNRVDNFGENKAYTYDHSA